ncbi:hypothetical protein C8N39_102249 [Dietzia psychralcaliphila]|nr:hypothetical protein C8N39_102249 [Dietzia psychralcaliphila]
MAVCQAVDPRPVRRLAGCTGLRDRRPCRDPVFRGNPVAAESPYAAPVRGALLMPIFDFSQLQTFWDGIFPAVFGPLAGFVDTIGASVEGP